MLWWETHSGAWSQRWLQRSWITALSLGLVITLVSNPHRSLSAVVPDSFVPWLHRSPALMLQQRAAALSAVSLVPPQASVAADTPLLPLLAQRSVAIRFPNGVRYLQRDGRPASVDWVVAFPGYYTPMTPVFSWESDQRAEILGDLKALLESGRYQQVYERAGVVVLRRRAAALPPQPG
jgi:hypothetical protein